MAPWRFPRAGFITLSHLFRQSTALVPSVNHPLATGGGIFARRYGLSLVLTTSRNVWCRTRI
jgi:hypothetical protein